jgi:hypothetical protein
VRHCFEESLANAGGAFLARKRVFTTEFTRLVRIHRLGDACECPSALFGKRRDFLIVPEQVGGRILGVERLDGTTSGSFAKPLPLRFVI